MKKAALLTVWAVMTILCLFMTMSGCERQNLNCLEMVLEPRTFSEREVEEAFESVKEAFPQRFKNSDLISLIYSEEMQNLTVMDPDPNTEDIVVSVTICGTDYHNSRDRAEYYCILNRVPYGDWFVHDWVLDVHSRSVN